MSRFAVRSRSSEIIDDLSRPQHEFDLAYRELSTINRKLGGIRAIERFLPKSSNLLILDVAAGGCDVSEAVARRLDCRVVALDLNPKGLHRADRAFPVAADALNMPFQDRTFDVVMASLFFHHLSNDQCREVLKNMWRITKKLVLVNDLHRHRVAYLSIRVLSAIFSKSRMVRHDGPLSVLRAFRPNELLEIATSAGIPARVYRSFPYRLVLVAEK